jgi:outer membrane protein assembly factor BamB
MKRLFVCAALACCGQSAVPSRVALPSQPAPAAAASVARPAPVVRLVVNDRIVDPADGRVASLLADVPRWATAEPHGPRAFLVDGFVVDAASGAKTRLWPVADQRDGALVRYESDGRVRWRRALPGVRSVRPPDVATGSGRVVATVDDELFAFDDAAGAPVWKARGPADRLATDGTYLYTTDCSVHPAPRWLVVRRMADGKVTARASLPADFDPEVNVDARHVVVVDSSRDETVVLDHAGNRAYALHETLFDSHLLRAGTLVVTNRRIALLDDHGRAVWQVGPPRDTVGADVIVANYGAIHDSGIEVTRLRASTGAIVWKTEVPALGVAHSKYVHRAYVVVAGSSVFVVSQGSYGSFFERLSLATGQREKRVVLDR